MNTISDKAFLPLFLFVFLLKRSQSLNKAATAKILVTSQSRGHDLADRGLPFSQEVEGSIPTGSTCPNNFSGPIDQEIRTHCVSWLVGWSLTVPWDSTSVYERISGRLQERGKMKRELIDERKNVQTTPIRTCWKNSRPLPYYYQK